MFVGNTVRVGGYVISISRIGFVRIIIESYVVVLVPVLTKR